MKHLSDLTSLRFEPQSEACDEPRHSFAVEMTSGRDEYSSKIETQKMKCKDNILCSRSYISLSGSRVI